MPIIYIPVPVEEKPDFEGLVSVSTDGGKNFDQMIFYTNWMTPTITHWLKPISITQQEYNSIVNSLK